MAVGVPDSMLSMVAEYDDWAAEQDTGSVVDVLGAKPEKCFCTRVKGDSMPPRSLTGERCCGKCKTPTPPKAFIFFGK